MFCGRGGQRSGQNHSKGDFVFNLPCRDYLHRDEHQHPGSDSVAGTERNRRLGCEEIHHLRLHAASLRQLGGYACNCFDHVDGVRLVFSLLLGYSRVPYAAAVDGDYFRSFSRVHPEHHFPNVSLLVLGTLAVLFCLLRLQDVIAALVVIRLMIQFLAQTVGVILFRMRRPDVPRPFKMWFYPLPAVLALAGYLYVLVMRRDSTRELQYGIAILVIGGICFLLRNWKRKDWPFGASR